MPTRFGEFRFLDGKKGKPPAQVKFQAQKWDEGQQKWVASAIIDRGIVSKGVIYAWSSTPEAPWNAPDWEDHEIKRVLVQVTMGTEENGYVIEQDGAHSHGVQGASLAIWGKPPEEGLSAWLLGAPASMEDPTCGPAPWGQGDCVWVE